MSSSQYDDDSKKGAWTPEEDEQLKELVSLYGPKGWSVIAKDVPGRSGKSCRLRCVLPAHNAAALNTLKGTKMRQRDIVYTCVCQDITATRSYVPIMRTFNNGQTTLPPQSLVHLCHQMATCGWLRA